MNIKQLIDTWDDDGRYREWYVVEEIKLGGEPFQIYIAEYEQAADFAQKMVIGYNAEEMPGQFGYSEDWPFYRLISVPQDEALKLFKEKYGSDEEFTVKTWTTAAEAADILGVTKSRVYSLAREGILEAKRDGSQMLISHASILARLKSNPGPGRPWN